MFFDLPTETRPERKAYAKFRKFLIRNGFLMMQESVYCKLALNQTNANYILDNIKRNKPEKGLIQVLTVTEKQFSKIEYIVGSKSGDIIDTDERLVVL